MPSRDIHEVADLPRRLEGDSLNVGLSAEGIVISIYRGSRLLSFYVLPFDEAPEIGDYIHQLRPGDANVN